MRVGLAAFTSRGEGLLEKVRQAYLGSQGNHICQDDQVSRANQVNQANQGIHGSSEVQGSYGNQEGYRNQEDHGNQGIHLKKGWQEFQACQTSLAQSFVVYDKAQCSAKEWVGQNFSTCEALIFVGAVGIAVRLIAPHITTKDKDPAVVVLDENGRFVISLLSGHLGGANELTEKLARFLGAEAVITTATDTHGVFAVDVWSREQGCFIADIGKIKDVSSRLLHGEQVGFFSDFPLEGSLPQGLVDPWEKDACLCHNDEHDGLHGHLDNGSQNELDDVSGGFDTTLRDALNNGLNERHGGWAKGKYRSCARGGDAAAVRAEPPCGEGDLPSLPPVGIYVSLQTTEHPFATTLHVIPRIVIAGVGCRKGVAPQKFERFILDTLERMGMSVKALTTLASIDLKKNEGCCVDFSRKYTLNFLTFSSDELNGVRGDFTSSSFVQEVTGVDNVCERAAFAAGAKHLILSKTSCDGMTLALAVPDWTCRFFP